MISPTPWWISDLNEQITFVLVSMCGVMLAMIIFVLGRFKFPVSLIFFERFPRTTVLFLELCHIAHHHPVFVLWLLLVLTALLWILLLLLFPRCLSISRVHIPYSPSSRYTIKKQFHVCSGAFLRVHPVFLPQSLTKRYIILKLRFSKLNSSFIDKFLKIFL